MSDEEIDNGSLSDLLSVSSDDVSILIQHDYNAVATYYNYA